MGLRENILEEREKRIYLIRKFMKESEKFIIIIKCNVCGNDKNFSYLECVKKYFLNLVYQNFNVYKSNYYASADGNYYLVQINDREELIIKNELIMLEEQAFGRYIDLDLYTNLEHSISRGSLGIKSRKCIICGGKTIECMRMSKHSAEEVLSKMERDVKVQLVNELVSYAKEAMTEEVSVDLKFGLVTKNSCGKHLDMDYNLFIKSIESISQNIFAYANVGFDLNENSFETLRTIGIDIENSMFNATNGVNTHKGLIFLLGFVMPSIIDCLYNNKQFTTIEKNIKFLAKDIMKDFTTKKIKNTFGVKSYVKYSILGVRGEVLNGLDKVFNAVRLFECYEGTNDKLVLDLLLHYMSILDDTVILHSQDLGFLKYLKTVARNIIDVGGSRSESGLNLIKAYTNEFINLGVSPGGSADMVAITLLLLKVKKQFYREA
ncbi:MAG: triphosphoribosyl-dephospho-CoA synthase [Bacilli bacterium]